MRRERTYLHSDIILHMLTIVAANSPRKHVFSDSAKRRPRQGALQRKLVEPRPSRAICRYAMHRYAMHRHAMYQHAKRPHPLLVVLLGLHLRAASQHGASARP
jgi:hypothetical protein